MMVDGEDSVATVDMKQGTKLRKPTRQLGTEVPFEIKEAGGAKVERCSQRGIGTNLRIWKLHRSLIFFSFKGQRFDVHHDGR